MNAKDTDNLSQPQPPPPPFSDPQQARHNSMTTTNKGSTGMIRDSAMVELADPFRVAFTLWHGIRTNSENAITRPAVRQEEGEAWDPDRKKRKKDLRNLSVTSLPTHDAGGYSNSSSLPYLDSWKALCYVIHHPRTMYAQNKSLGKYARAVCIISALVIFISNVLFVITTLPSNYCRTAHHVDCIPSYYACQIACEIYFLVEFVLMIGVHPCRKKMFHAFLMWVNSLALLSFLSEIIYAIANNGDTDYDSVQYLRVVRMFRMLRTFRYLQYHPGYIVLVPIVRQSVHILVVGLIAICSSVWLVGALAFFAAKTPPDPPPNTTRMLGRSTFDAMYWCTTTLTTVGYGDSGYPPQTGFGRTLAAFTMILGLLLLAVPVSVLCSNFTARLLSSDEQSAVVHNVYLNMEEIESLLVGHVELIMDVRTLLAIATDPSADERIQKKVEMTLLHVLWCYRGCMKDIVLKEGDTIPSSVIEARRLWFTRSLKRLMKTKRAVMTSARDHLRWALI
eukprot:PhF_6_TR23824/c0_g1_i1/m.33389/K04874/KCNA1; potassium voltage-gated channel Shaker-related subfamily A member 1